ncbi:hypothetical protein [Capnocytophaga ochracea]|uniref:hypothetical protein n=1 Tax=Capnocytophaga ochracea TaxID=1018 RepID=UPI002B45A0ED|nr:hypothetical protein [Capnocytophaga ochracea]MEB3036014.1 hypothetical protein [Capnocytophaga ochracea]
MTKGLLTRIRITDDTVFNLFEDTKGQGAIGITIRNDGETPFIIEDGVNEEFAPKEYFMCENTIPVINTAFRVSFKKQTGKVNSAIMSYVVPIIESNNNNIEN